MVFIVIGKENDEAIEKSQAGFCCMLKCASYIK